MNLARPVRFNQQHQGIKCGRMSPPVFRARHNPTESGSCECDRRRYDVYSREVGMHETSHGVFGSVAPRLCSRLSARLRACWCPPAGPAKEPASPERLRSCRCHPLRPETSLLCSVHPTRHAALFEIEIWNRRDPYGVVCRAAAGQAPDLRELR
jgi:hypothetical protein